MTSSAFSVIIPAHNEEATLPHLLNPLVAGLPGDGVEVIVVCNGCTDRTSAVARRYGKPVIVVDVPEPSKQLAMRTGDDSALFYPRVFVDADVEIQSSALEKLAAKLGDSTGVLAVAPERRLVLNGSSWPVRSYYRLWVALPQVGGGLFGRGVIALSEEGMNRVRRLPSVMSDDLAISEAFGPEEREIVAEAVVVVVAPRTMSDLVRRRIRIYTGTAQAVHEGLVGSSARTSMRSLFRVAARRPRLWCDLPVFLMVTLVSRTMGRRAVNRGDFATWKRDESSRRR